KMDDVGLYMSRTSDSLRRAIGRAILAIAPYLLKLISIVGTAAMFMVGGGILLHGTPGAEELIHDSTKGAGTLLAWIAAAAINGIAGIAAGAIALAGVVGVQRVYKA